MLDRPTTSYFRHVRLRPDRSVVHVDWTVLVIDELEVEEIQWDGRVRRWRRIPEAGGRALRVILLPDRTTIHNAFFARDFAEPSDEGQVF